MPLADDHPGSGVSVLSEGEGAGQVNRGSSSDQVAEPGPVCETRPRGQGEGCPYPGCMQCRCSSRCSCRGSPITVPGMLSTGAPVPAGILDTLLLREPDWMQNDWTELWTSTIAKP